MTVMMKMPKLLVDSPMTRKINHLGIASDVAIGSEAEVGVEVVVVCQGWRD